MPRRTSRRPGRARSRPRRRSGNSSRPTSAGAPGTRASSRRCWPRPVPATRQAVHDLDLPMTVMGTRVPRKEDPRLLHGRGAFADGFHARGELWARIVRSPVAHGRVRAVDVTKARRADGVAAAVSAAELPPGLAIPVRLALRGLSLTE